MRRRYFLRVDKGDQLARDARAAAERGQLELARQLRTEFDRLYDELEADALVARGKDSRQIQYGETEAE